MVRKKMKKNKTEKTKKFKSLKKAVSWRVVASVTTMIIAYLFIGSIEIALGIGAIESLLKIGLYYLHERLWE